jgi:hypothetical protein
MFEKRFWLAVLISVICGFCTCYLAIYGLRTYGLALFVLLPLLIGFITTTVYGINGELSFLKSFCASFFAAIILSSLLIIVAIEGLICLIMASPLALGMIAIGCGLANALLKATKSPTLPRNISVFLILFLPFLLSFEASNKSEATLHKVVTTVEITAPIEKVWKTVLAFPQIDKKPEGILKFGFAYPVNAEIKGEGVGAMRYCNFNTGAFVEPITVWNEPNLLAFDVQKQPQAMVEMSIYNDLHAPHIDYIQSKRGQFRLYEKNGKTILEGTTFYTHDILPDFYWKLWSDYIIHQIHLRVLNHIKEVAEK